MKRLSFLLNKKIMIGIAAVIIFIYFTIQVYAETPTDMGEPQNESELFLLQDISDIVPNIDDRDAVYGQYVSMLFGGESDDNIFLDEEVYRGNLLLDDPFDRESYKIVTNEVKMIANGDKIETNVQIDIDELIGEVDGEKYASFGYTLNELGFVDGENPTDEDIIERIKEKSFPDIHLVYKALYEDRGDLLYWSHGAMIGTYNGVLNKCEQNGETRYKLDGAYKKIFFKVFPYYMISGSTNQFMVDTNKTGAAVRALNNAKAIINEAENGLYDTDYKKICFFRDKICELNSYNFDAVSSEWDKSDMNPWKIIYVFDEDPLTNVVCDGYARAFKYLVENTEFDSDYINCDTVTGDLIQYQNDNLVSKGAHKWCIIRMDDGQRYFVDITGCDSGDSNSSDLKSLFFLNGVNNITEDRKYKGYSVSKWGYTYEYLYEDSTYELYNDEELIVSETSYEPSAYIAPTQKNSITSASIQEIPEMTFKPNEEIRPIVTILYNGERLVEGRDYLVRYSDNASVGKAGIDIIGIGKYDGIKTVYFSIIPQTVTIDAKFIENINDRYVRISYQSVAEGSDQYTSVYNIYRNGQMIGNVSKNGNRYFDDRGFESGENIYFLRAVAMGTDGKYYLSIPSAEKKIYIPHIYNGDNVNKKNDESANNKLPDNQQNDNRENTSQEKIKRKSSEEETLMQKENVKSFVNRMYTVALGREADEVGLNDWTEQLMSGTSDGATLARGFICSQEFKNMGLSDEGYLNTLYHTFFNREPDAGGMTGWMNVLSGGASRESVLAGFVNSTEFANLCDNYGIARGTMETDASNTYNKGVRDFVLRNYTETLGRPGETAGVEDWTHRINKGEMTPKDVAESFLHSQEFINKGLNNEEYIKVLYRTFLGREFDEGGLNYWMGEIRTRGRDGIVSGFSDSLEFISIMQQYGLR